MSKQLYFRCEDDTICYDLDYFLEEAKSDGLKNITLIKAEPDSSNDDYVYCRYFEDVVERRNCKKSCCSLYNPNRSGRGVCINRGKLFHHGEKVQFDII